MIASNATKAISIPNAIISFEVISLGVLLMTYHHLPVLESRGKIPIF